MIRGRNCIAVVYTAVLPCVLGNYTVEKSLGWLWEHLHVCWFPLSLGNVDFWKLQLLSALLTSLPCCLSNMVSFTSSLRDYLFQSPHSFLIYLIHPFSIRPRISYHVLDTLSYKHLIPSLLSPQLLCFLNSWSGLIACLSTPFPKLEPKHWFPKLPILSQLHIQ